MSIGTSTGHEIVCSILKELARIGNYQSVMTNKTGEVSGAPIAPLKINWEAELARHDHWLRTIAYARLGERETVEEIMQEVAVAAVRQAAPLKDATKVAPWLYRLVVRQVLLYRRKMGRERKLNAGYAHTRHRWDEDRQTPDPLSWLLADERQQQVREAIGRLSERDTEILMLKYMENWNYHRIAEYLGISHSAVESRLHRARKRLRSELVVEKVIESS